MWKLDKILMLLILVTIILFSVTGCARPGYWRIIGREPGPFTEEEKAKFRQDLYECDKDSRVSSVYGGRSWVDTAHYTDKNFFFRCMKLKNYEWVQGTPTGEYYNPLK
jgi:hypothetical protein